MKAGNIFMLNLKRRNMKLNGGKKLLFSINFFIGVVLLFTIYYKPVSASTNRQTVILSENGIQIEITLPNHVTDVEIFHNNSVIMKLNGATVTLEIDKDTVKNSIKLSESVYKTLNEDKPDTTFFEKIPDVTTDTNNFSITKLIYKNHNAEQSTNIEAVTKLNFRYIYNISIRADKDIPYEIINEFTTFKLTKTKFKLDEGFLILSSGFFIAGLLIIISQIIKKHFWVKSTGTMTDLRRAGKVNYIYITHYLENGKKIDTKSNVSYFSSLLYFQQGKSVNISYSRRNPRKVDILSNKTPLIVAVFLWLIAANVIYIMIFKL